MPKGLAIQGKVTARRGDDWIKLDADDDRIDIQVPSLSTLRELRQAVLAAVPADDAVGPQSFAEAVQRLRRQGVSLQLRVGDRLIAEAGPNVEPNFAARVTGLSPFRVHAVKVMRSWLSGRA